MKEQLLKLLAMPLDELPDDDYRFLLKNFRLAVELANGTQWGPDTVAANLEYL